MKKIKIVAAATGVVVVGVGGWYALKALGRRRVVPGPVTISDAVGEGATNHPQDVLAVRQRLVSRGFTWATGSSRIDSNLIETLRLVGSIVRGQHVVGGPGRVSVGATWLRDDTVTPRWVQMPAKGSGFVNFELSDLSDNHDYGTRWMAEVIKAAGVSYERSHRQKNGGALLTVNDVSLPRGGNTPDHSGHECGLACDLRLPRKDGGAGGLRYTEPEYDGDAARAQLVALSNQPRVTRVLFNDPKLVADGLCRRAAGHDDHIHFEIAPGQLRVTSRG